MNKGKFRSIKTLSLVSVLFLTLMLSACGSKEAEMPTASSSEVILINHPQKAFGGEVPEWVRLVAGGGSNTELSELYDKYVVFTDTKQGENLDALKFWLNDFDINKTVSTQLNTAFSSKAAAITNATADEIERSADALTAVTSKATFSGLKKESEYWLQYSTADDNTYYDYYVLYIMDKKLWNEQLAAIIKQLSAQDKKIVTPVLDKVTEAGLFE